MADWNCLQGIKTVHFVGIGGSGMSPLAEILHDRGFTVRGSDWGESDNIKRLQALGVQVIKGHAAENIIGADLVVYTSAVNAENPELVAAKESGVPLMERARLLGLISKQYARSVAVAGTHGKTTTTSMLSQVLVKAALDPSLFIGGRLPLINANGRAGRSDIMVCEACEFQDHYLAMQPACGIILNVDADHLNYFGTLENVIKSFHNFAQLCTDALIVNGDDENTQQAVACITGRTIIRFGLSDGCDWTAKSLTVTRGSYYAYDAYCGGQFFAHIELSVPGKHNVLNSLSVIAAAVRLGLSAEQIADGIRSFGGAGRRFEILGTFGGITIVDDYAHHPTEITATLTAARAMGYRKLWAVFQPFTFSRTARHLDGFAQALSIADEAVVSDIMGSRETNEWNVYAYQITDKMAHGTYIADFPAIADYMAEHAQPDDLIVTMGGGDIYKCARMIAEKLK